MTLCVFYLFFIAAFCFVLFLFLQPLLLWVYEDKDKKCRVTVKLNNFRYENSKTVKKKHDLCYKCFNYVDSLLISHKNRWRSPCQKWSSGGTFTICNRFVINIVCKGVRDHIYSTLEVCHLFYFFYVCVVLTPRSISPGKDPQRDQKVRTAQGLNFKTKCLCLKAVV